MALESGENQMAQKYPTLAELRADLDARAIMAKLVMDALRRNDISDCGAAQKAMREAFPAKIGA